MSQRKTDSNRINAKKSTGPKSEAGKATVGQNARKLGMYTKDAVLPTEDAAQFRSLLSAFRAEHQPATPTEDYLVENIVTAIWRRRRIQAVEVGLLDLQTCEQFTELRKHFAVVTENAETANAVRVDFNSARALSDLWRHDARLDRSVSRSLKELQRLKDLRPDQPGSMGPQSEEQKSQNQSQIPITPIESIPPEEAPIPRSVLRQPVPAPALQRTEWNHKHFLSDYAIAFGGGLS